MRTRLEMLKGYLDDEGDAPTIELKVAFLKELVEEIEEFLVPVIPGAIVRLSIPGYLCTNCGTKMGHELKCSGCGWVDPMTKRDDS